MKKKILFVIDSLNSGGAEKSLVSLLSLINYEKFSVDLLLLKKEGLYLPLIPNQVNLLEAPDYFNKLKKNNFIIRLTKLKNSLRLRNPYYKKVYHNSQIIAPNIIKHLNKQDKIYDIAIAYSQGLPTYYVIDKVEAYKKICWINTNYEKAGYNIEFDKNYYRKYKYIVTVSENNKLILEQVYPEFKSKIKVFFDIISEELVKNMANIEGGYNDNFDGIKILTIGRHVEVKGYDLAIKAAKILKDKKINFRWYSIGEGSLSERLKIEVKKNGLIDEFVFLGTFVNPYPFIKMCDIYCQPSRFEGFGMAIAEALILNKIVVTTNFENVYDQIKNEENGIIVQMDPDKISKSIIRIINDRKFREKIIMGTKRKNLNNKFNIDEFYNLILN